MHLSSAERYAPVTCKNKCIIKHCRNSMMFFYEERCTKKETKSSFYVSMGSFYGGKRRHLVGFYTQILPAKWINKENFDEENGMKE